MNKQHISMFRVGILIVIMLFSVLLLSSNVNSFYLFENYDNVTAPANFTGGVVNSSFAYTTTNGYAQQRNSFSQLPYIPKYANITTTNPNITFKNLYKTECDYCSSPNTFYLYQGITYKNTSGFQENMFIAHGQGNFSLYNRTFWLFIRNQTSWTGYNSIYNFTCGITDFNINNIWYGLYMYFYNNKTIVIRIFNVSDDSLFCSKTITPSNTIDRKSVV